MQPTRVLMLLTGMELGGAEWQTLHLCSGLQKKGYVIKVVSMIPIGALGEKIQERGLEIVSLGMKRGIPDPRALMRLAKIIRAWQPHILHCHMVHANLLGRCVRWFARIPVVISTAHNINEGACWREWAYGLTDRFCDLTTQVSRAGMKRYLRIGAVSENKIRFVPNCVDLDLFHPDLSSREMTRKQFGLEERFVWLAVGRFDEQKDYPNMLHAFARAIAEYPQQLLLIAGQGVLKKRMEQLARELEIHQQIRFLGIRQDIPVLMNLADGCLMSSAWEGMSLVLLEASASALPIVATDVGGNREVILEGKSGFLVPPKNFTALTNAMLRLVRLSRDERQKMGHAGREHVAQNYASSYVVDLWDNLYREFLEKKL
ncbi:MAG: glycosyltransferase [Verrucomicrobiota bacterium]